MGIIVEYIDLERQRRQLLSRLVVYYKKFMKIKEEPISISVRLSEELAKVKEKRRSMKLEQCFRTVLSELPDGVVVKDIDVMFNPAYQVDVLRIIVNVRKEKNFSVVWPGECRDGKLIYAEEGYPDYKVYNVADYDVACII